MAVPRVFVSYHFVDTAFDDHRFLKRLIEDLQTAGVDVVEGGDNIPEDKFVQTLNSELPTCEWLILVQTPEAFHSPRIHMTVNTALNLIAQQRMRGVLRVIAIPSDPEELPPTWTTLSAFEADQSYPRAMAKLLLTLGLIRSTGSSGTQMAGTPMPLEKGVSWHHSPGPYDAHMSVVSSPPFSFVTDDSPVKLSSFRKPWSGRRRKRLLLGLLALVLLLVSGSLLSVLFLFSHTPPATATNKVVGSVFFTSTGMLNENSNLGLNDEVLIDLSNIPIPASGKSYYAWLLPDKNQQLEIPPILLGKLPVRDGAVHFNYLAPSHINLLAIASRFLVTKEDANTPPQNPSLAKSAWLYYAEFSAIPNPSDTLQHFSLLDHLRHLLASDPKLKKVSLPGGLSIWFYQNIGKILEWATAAKGTGPIQDPAFIHRHFVRILDYLDGSALVAQDVPSGTPILTDPKVTQVPLLTLDPQHQDPPGYVRHMGIHLQALIDSPGVTNQQRELAQQVGAALDKVGAELALIRQIAIKLVHMSNAQLLDPATQSLLTDLVEHANNAYVGQVDPTTGLRQGGATWIYDHIQHLATLVVVKYTP